MTGRRLLGALLGAVLLASTGLGQDLDALARQLRDSDRYERAKAVEPLAELGSDEAWELVLGALADPYGRVADRAQLALAKLPGALVPELFGKSGLKSRRELVALRVAELLGRLEAPLEEGRWLEALKHKDPDVRRSLLWSVERQARAERLDARAEELVEAVSKLAARDRSELLKAQALVTLGALAPEAARPFLAEFAQATGVPMRAAAAELSGLFEADAAEQALLRALADGALVVRLRAYEGLAARGDREALLHLISALGSEQVLRSRWRLVGLLRELSGMKYGLDPRPWDRWAAELPEDWTRADRRESEALGGDVTASFVGVPVLSERLAFLIDFSGSMFEERDGVTRKQRVDVELRKALGSLDPAVAFNLHAYHREVLRWQKKLTEAKPRNVKKALSYFEGLKDSGTGDFWRAALEAMQDPEVDTLMVLTDGAPSGGARWSLELMRELFQHENRFRGVAVDALLIDASKGLAFHWQDLCGRTGGRAQTVEL